MIVNTYFTTEGIGIMKIRKMFAKKNEYVTKTGVVDVPFDNYELRSTNITSPIVKYNGGVWDELLSFIGEEIASDMGDDLADDEMMEIKRCVRDTADIAISMDMKHMRLFSDVDEATGEYTTYHTGLTVFYELTSYGYSDNFSCVLLLAEAELRHFVEKFFIQTAEQAEMDGKAFEMHREIAYSLLG